MTGRLEEIRNEAIEQEAYWRARRVGYLRIGLEEARDAGMTVAKAAAYLGITQNALYAACYRHRIKLAKASRPRRASSLVDHSIACSAPANIEIRETIRDTALANRGKATAAEIAAAIGVTRNAIIGHWFRARKEGASA